MIYASPLSQQRPLTFYNPKIKSFYERKKAKTKIVVALKAVAHKLCRACYYIMRDRVAFDVTKAFGQK